MFIRKNIRLALLVAIAVTAAVSTGSAAPVTGSSTQVPEITHTTFTTALNGVQLSSETLPGIPRQLPIQSKPGGKVSLGSLCGGSAQANASSSSTASINICQGGGSTSHDFYFQWWMTIYNGNRMQYSFSQWYDWTGNGKTVSYFQTGCIGNAGYWTYKGCYTGKSATGRSFVKATGNWTFGCCQNDYWNYHKYPHAEANALADGTISGTVYN